MRTMKADTRTTRRALLAGLAAGMAVGPRALAAGLPEVAVTKDPTCGCCEKWVTHLREAGFVVTVTVGPVNPVKARLGVPRDLASCHTAQVDGYVVEGHVPAGAIKRLLAERPQGAGWPSRACRSARQAWRSRAWNRMSTRSCGSGLRDDPGSSATAAASWLEPARRLSLELWQASGRPA